MGTWFLMNYNLLRYRHQTDEFWGNTVLANPADASLSHFWKDNISPKALSSCSFCKPRIMGWINRETFFCLYTTQGMFWMLRLPITRTLQWLNHIFSINLSIPWDYGHWRQKNAMLLMTCFFNPHLLIHNNLFATLADYFVKPWRKSWYNSASPWPVHQ